jgi:hypothetical protein
MTSWCGYEILVVIIKPHPKNRRCDNARLLAKNTAGKIPRILPSRGETP